MMVEARKNDDKEPVADSAPADLSRFAEASTKLFAEQAAAMAMMTAYGMSVAAQMTGMMLGALRGPASEDMPEADTPTEPKPAPVEQKPTAKVVELRPKPTAAKPAPVAEATKPAAKASKSAPKAVQPVKVATVAPKAPAAKPAKKAVAKAAPAAKAVTAAGDDLKKISGIGPRLEQELNARGIVGYADIAALTKAAVKKLDTELGLEGRITRDGWASQAKALSGGKG